MIFPKYIWFLHDASNSNERSRNYMWWFETRELAREHKRHHASNPGRYARLLGPFKCKVIK